MRRDLARFALGAAATLLALLLVEGLARLIGVPPEYGQIIPLHDKPTRQVDGIDLWESATPRASEADLGAAAADRDAFTIIGLGDSIMYGMSQPKEATYLELARQRLAAESGRRVRALNLASPGFNTLQEHARYKEVAERVPHDLVLVHYWTNDLHQYRVVGGYVVDFADISADGRLVIRALPLPDALSDWLLVHSRAYGLLTRFVLDYKRRNQPTDWTAVQKPLAEIDARARAAGARLVVLASPQMTGEGPERTWDFDVLAQFAAERGIELIDLAQWLAGYPSQELSFDGSHLTARGHQLLAEQLADYLLARDLSPAARPDPIQ